MAEWLASLTELHAMTAGTVYLVVFGLVFVESGLLVGFFLPGDSVLFAAGLLAATPGTGLSVTVLAPGVFAAAVAGDAVGYWTGRRLGRPWLLRRAAREDGRGRRAGAMVRRIELTERLYARFGWVAVVAARFIPWVRTFTPIVAGIARMPYARFLSANVVGAGIWGSGLVLLGYVGHQVPEVRAAAYVVAGLAILSSIVVATVGWWRRRRRSRPALTSS